MRQSRFDAAASGWDTPPRIEIAKSAFTAIHVRGLIKENARMLDFGAGTGLLAIPLSETAQEVIALDTSSEMLRVLQEKCATQNISNVHTIHANIFSPKLQIGPFDLIVSSMTLHHVRDTQSLLARFYELLVTNGYIALVDLDKEDGTFHSDNAGVEHFGFDRKALISLAKTIGFSEVSCEIIHTLQRPRGGAMKGYGIFLLCGKKV